MKQIIVVMIKEFNDQKSLCRILTPLVCFSRPNPWTRALKTVVSVHGVEQAAFGGKEKDQIEVRGDGIDAVHLTDLLRRRLGYADLISVSPVEEKKEVVWSFGVPQYQIYETIDASLTSITPVGDDEDTEMEPEIMPLVSSIGGPDQVRVYEMKDANLTSITPVGDDEDTEMEPEIMPLASLIGVPDQVRVYEMKDASLTSITPPVGDNQDTEVEPEILPMVSSNGVPDQCQVYEMRDSSLITQYINPYGGVNLYIFCTNDH